MAGRGPLWSAPPNPYIHLLNAPHYEFILSFIEPQKLIWHKFHCKALETLISKVILKQILVSLDTRFLGRWQNTGWYTSVDVGWLSTRLVLCRLLTSSHKLPACPTQGPLVPGSVLLAGGALGRAGLGLPAGCPGASLRPVLVRTGVEGRVSWVSPVGALTPFSVGTCVFHAEMSWLASAPCPGGRSAGDLSVLTGCPPLPEPSVSTVCGAVPALRPRGLHLYSFSSF